MISLEKGNMLEFPHLKRTNPTLRIFLGIVMIFAHFSDIIWSPHNTGQATIIDLAGDCTGVSAECYLVSRRVSYSAYQKGFTSITDRSSEELY